MTTRDIFESFFLIVPAVSVVVLDKDQKKTFGLLIQRESVECRDDDDADDSDDQTTATTTREFTAVSTKAKISTVLPSWEK